MRRGVIVSDFQVGSFYGILPPAFETSAGIVIPQNIGQTYLWNCWDDFTNRAHHWEPEFVIVGGDGPEGKQRKSGGVGLSLRMIVDQVEAWIAVLQLLKARIPPSAKWYFVAGTQYHVGENAHYEEEVAARMGAERYFSVGEGRLVREVLWLDVDGVLIEDAHHISGTSGFYRVTALDREMQWAAMAAKDVTKGIPKVDLHIRHHVHHFLSAEHASKQGLVCPCWQLQTQYARKSSIHRLLPDIGGVFLEIDPEAKKRGEAPCHIRKQLYSLPPAPVTRL